jgi:hypothetical protein
MKKYNAPEIEIHAYALAANAVFTGSDPTSQEDNDLHKDDEYDYFGNN